MGFPFDIKGRFESFIEEFTDEEGQLKYQEKIREMETIGARSLYVYYNDLLIQDPKLAKEILVNPEASIAAGEEILTSKIAEMSPGYLDRLKQVHIRITDLSEKLMLRSLKTEHLDILTCFEGIVIGVTEAKPLMISAHFRCASCGENQIVDFPEGIYTPPYQCRNEHCQRKGSLQLQLDRSVFIDWQKITLQEKPEELPPGQLPQSTSIHVLDDLVDRARPGDRVEIVGILKARVTRLLKRGQLATYGKFFHGVSVSRETEEFVDIEISEEDELKIIDLSKSPYIIEKIRDSLAPSIYGRDLVKEAIASLLFGGTTKITPDGLKLRGESNLLIVGDPGTGKSIHGSEKIYVGAQFPTGFKWGCEQIGPFIDNLMNTYHENIITTGETELLRLEEGVDVYTASLSPNILKTKKSEIVEVSRHQTKDLVRIRTRSGRNILATPDHSFSTLVNGQLEVICAANLNESSYIPIARNIQIDESEIITSIDFSKIFSKKELVKAEVIRNQIVRIHENETNFLMASKLANVTPETLREYLSDLTSFPKGNWMRRKYDTSWFPSIIKLDEAFGRIIGFYLAEGSVEKVSIRFTNTDEEIIGQISADLQKIFKRSCLIENGVIFNQSSIKKWFQETFGTGAGNKVLPSLFLATPLNFRQALLSAYFTGDGWIEEKSAAVSAITKSKALAYSISDLLATLGIFSSVRAKIIKSGKYEGRVYYRIIIAGDELNSFYSQVGFLSSSKQQRLEKFVKKLFTRKRYQSRDIIPNFGSLLTDVARTLDLKGIRGTWERSFLGELRGKKHRQRLGRKYLQKVVKKFNELNEEEEAIEKLDWLKVLAFSDVFWDKITKIEKITESSTVYDIGTEEGHFIVANGNLIVHNSQILKFVAQLAPRALYTTGKGSTAAGLCVSGDSTIFLSDRVTSISDLVISEFEKGGIEKYTEKIEYKKIQADYTTYHSKNLNITTNPISRVWRIKTPEKLYRIITRTGNEIVLTPETSLLSISDKGLIWKQARMLKKSERVATSRHLLIKERNEVPSVYELIADYPHEIILTNAAKNITDLLKKIKIKSTMTNKDITNYLGVSEDSIYRWKNSERPGNISLRLFGDLCQLAGSDIETQLPKMIEIEIKKGQRLNLPKRLDKNWFYILGVIFGDGRVSVDNKEGRYGGVCIGLSNREESLLKDFDEFCKKISIKVNKRNGTEERPTEYRIWSKILFHIFSKFGLTSSPKSSTLNPPKDMLYYPEEYLYNFLRGLYDSDGWISVRKRGSSQIGITSASKDLIEFVRYSLLTLGIITYTRQIEPKIVTKKSGRKIIGKKVKYELTFNSFSNFKKFEEKIGFRHPIKSEILHNYCLTKKQSHRNVDNVPSARALLKPIVNFYGYTSRELTGYKGAFTVSQLKKAMNRYQLKAILEKINPDWMRHKVRIPYEMRFQLYKELKTFILSSQTQLSKDQLYEYFIRENRDPWIPIGLVAKILNETEITPSQKIIKYFDELLSSIKQKEEVIKKNYELLVKICDSDIFWDEIVRVEKIVSPEDEYVYDLTIPETHNFVVNGFVTHNTAAVIRDQDTGEITLEAGALVLADQGIAMVDEFDKMRAEDRAAIHEAMEQHTISIAKAGIVATLNARTSILAAANPRRGRWNPFKATADNLNLPPTILSRFDLIFVLEDKPDLKEDHDLATHVLRLHKSQTLSTSPPIEQDLLRKYIAYARREIQPRLSAEAEERLLEYYKELRRSSGKVEEGQLEPIAITPRQLESLVRLAEARAKMRLCNEVTYDDASGAVNLMNATLEKLAKDTETGKLDIDKYASGISARSRRQLDRIDALIDKMLEEAEDDEPVAIKDIIDRGMEEGLNKNQIVKAIDEMTRRGILFEPQPGYVKRP